MRLLLDTHIALWAITDDPALPQAARSMIANPDHSVYVSAATIWEISIKHALKRLSMPVSSAEAVHFFRLSGYKFLDVSPEHAAKVATLPSFHQDPFDRMLVAQARTEPLVLITHDRKVAAYGEPVLLF